MHDDLTVGNAADDGAPFRGWFVGDIGRWTGAHGGAGLRDTKAVEIKWGVHAADMPRPDGWAAASPTVALAILVSGEFALAFRRAGTDDVTEVRLARTGDYVLWGETQEHTWWAVSDAVVLTVRWPAAVGHA
jgi:hypothetical protein